MGVCLRDLFISLEPSHVPPSGLATDEAFAFVTDVTGALDLATL